MFLTGIAKSHRNVLAIASKSEKEQQLSLWRKEAKNWYQNKAMKIKSDDFIESNKEKSVITIALLEREKKL